MRELVCMIMLAGLLSGAAAQPPQGPAGSAAKNGPVMMTPPHGGMMPREGGFGGLPPLFDINALSGMLNEMGVKNENASKIVDLSRQCMKEIESRHIALMRADLDIREELMKDAPDVKVIEPLVAKKMKVLGEIEINQLKRDIAIKALLTPEQYERWKSQYVKKMMARGGHGPMRSEGFAPEGAR